METHLSQIPTGEGVPERGHGNPLVLFWRIHEQGRLAGSQSSQHHQSHMTEVTEQSMSRHILWGEEVARKESQHSCCPSAGSHLMRLVILTTKSRTLFHMDMKQKADRGQRKEEIMANMKNT